jgi:hypothetical protein
MKIPSAYGGVAFSYPQTVRTPQTSLECPSFHPETKTAENIAQIAPSLPQTHPIGTNESKAETYSKEGPFHSVCKGAELLLL